MKDYKKILEGVMNIINTTEKSDIGFVNICTYISENCPELKESEDEQIRKWIIDDIRYNMNNEPLNNSEYKKKAEKAIAWLKKQGEQKIDNDDKTMLNACINTLRNVGHSHLATWLEKQKPMEDFNGDDYGIDSLWHAIRILEKTLGEVEGYQTDDGILEHKCAITAVRKLAKERREQKSVKKEEILHEPKFKVGDWITNGDYTWKIVEVQPLDYILQSQDCIIVDATISHVDNHFHLWSIEDAKAGDVIAADGYIILFKKLLPQNGGVSYCHYDYACTNPQFNFNEDNNWHFDKESTKIHPATKEEREQLEKAMADAGYVWLSGKKELKKIEQKPAENEELTEFDKAVGVSIGTWNPKSPEQIQSVKAVSKKLLKLAKKQINDEQKPVEWSRDDEDAIGMAIIALEDMYDEDTPNTTYGGYNLPFNKAAERLKSLRPQNRWKPSDEMLKALDIAIRAGIQLGSWEEKALRELQKQLKAL